ncbi:EFR1 family ferrodoxin [Anaerocolumna sp. MB42-C2]|uniref:EFR1 family ferrodoxin n=1 Tax=Anaerocolumna sp. MB42-C2 TaxID=3070997 RepID=UPI0027DFB33F|nr:EFR1 family ferrodoxin [Anaerocolumna sp. MB42-C2]WMJ89115.1 EFR1 family ferrodoxin [Anaerocolumna sp. MB42-C2]
MTKKLIIWYFTGTGQCRIISEYIGTMLKSEDLQVKLVNITPLEARNRLQDNIDCDQLILVFPVYASDMPEPLRKFMERLKGGGVPILLIALWGNAHKGNAIYHAWKITSGNGFIVNGAAEIVAEHSYLEPVLPIIGNRPTDAEKQELVEFVRKQFKKNTSIKLTDNKDKLFIKLLCSLPQGFVPKLVANLDFQESKCNGCGICRKMCPTGSINQDFKVDKKTCIMCLSCVTNCSGKARTCNIKEIAKTALGHHKKVKNKDIFYGKGY